MNAYTLIRWSNACDIGTTLYQRNLEQRVYLPAEPAGPEWDLSRDVLKTGLLREVTTFGETRERAALKFIAPEFLMDAITLLPLMTTAEMVTRHGDLVTMRDISITHEWLDSGCFCMVTLQFTPAINRDTLCCQEAST